MKRDPRVDAIAASDLSSAAILAALIGMLGAKGLLSNREVREVYEQALFLLEPIRAMRLRPSRSMRQRGKSSRPSCGRTRIPRRGEASAVRSCK